MAEDLRDFPLRTSGEVVCGDARARSAWDRIEPNTVDGCVSSPPYLNNFDYADATRLELFFLGMANSWAEMCSRVRAEMVVATTQQTLVRLADSASEEAPAWGPAGSKIIELSSRLAVERQRRDRGKEYDRVVPPYFADIRRVLSNVYVALRPGARMAWVIGDSAPYSVHLDTPALTAELAEAIGFELLEDRVLRSRGLRWRTNGSRHQVALTERLVVLRKPTP
jgi:hypothetical protein